MPKIRDRIKNTSCKTKLIVISLLLVALGISIVLSVVISSLSNAKRIDDTIKTVEQQMNNIVDDTDDSEEITESSNLDEEGYPIDSEGNRTSELRTLCKSDIDKLYKDSLEYNEKLKTHQSDMLVSTSSYESAALDLKKYGIYDGIYGYISAPSIDMKLPIYLGANSTNLSYGAAHLNCTSLPTGGESTNTVLSGHTGYIGRTFFDKLPKLKKGDTVTIKNYYGTNTYKVTEMGEYAVTSGNKMYISKGKDLLTLVTCSRGGKMRYLVVCERV